MLRNIFVLLLTLSLNLQAQTEAQKEFLHYCLHEANEAQMHTMQSIAKQTTRQRSCNYLARYLVPIDSHRAIRLRNSNITDISPLKYLKGTNEVSLSGNQITDITPLAQLTELTRVDLSDNPITEIKSLLGLKKLKSLTLYSNYQLQDISLLGKITTLESLSFSDLNCNTSFIRKLTKLEWLSIIRVDLKDLKDLKELSLSTTHLEDISDIIYLKNITHLELNKQPLLTDISPLKSLKKLKYLHIENVPIKDISALKELPNLKSLTLCNTKVADLSVLSGKHIELDQRDNDLRWCSPKKWDDLIKGVSCYEKDGTEKNWWKRVLRL
jgi:internalin A